MQDRPGARHGRERCRHRRVHPGVVALFGPARRRIRAFIDRRFYRSRYDVQKTLKAFASQLRDEVDISALSTGLFEVVTHSVQPRHASVWPLEGAAR